MTESVIKAIAKALNNSLEGYTIYIENVEQGLKQPCFFIYCKNYRDELYRGKRYKLGTDIVIEYIPSETDSKTNSNVNKVLSKLYDITEVIEVEGNILRGINRTVDNTEGGIVFNVSYEYFYYRQEEKEEMEKLKEKIYF